MSETVRSVEWVAEKLNLKPKKVSGKVRFIGANPTGTGATKDGFTLFAEGHAMDNNGSRYNSPEVARMADIEPSEYAPVIEFLKTQGSGPFVAASGDSAPFPWSDATVYDYTDAKGALLFQVGRVGSGDAKRISQRRPKAKGGWINNLGNVERVLYRLPEVLAARFILIVEGEKAVEAARAALADVALLGEFAVTTVPGGADKWREHHFESLAGRTVYVFPDRDEAGENHASRARDIWRGLAESARPESLRVVHLPNLPHKGDIADFLDAGESILRAVELAEATAPVGIEVEAKTPPPARFSRFSFADIGNIETPKWLIRDLLTERTISVLSADSGSFKSFFALDAALCVATGRAFHGRDVKRGAVIYVAAEGFWTLKDRAMAWSVFHGVPLPENFHIVNMPVDVAEPATLAAFVAEFADTNPSLIVLDTLSQNALSVSENSNDEMARFMSGMMELANRLKCHVQAVHHNSKAGLLRGASAIHNNADARISLERPENDQTNTVFVRCEKQRGKPFEPFALRGQQVELPYSDEYGEAVTSLVFELAGDAPRVVGDGRNDRKAANTAGLLDLLNTLRASLGKGESVSKDEWREQAIKRGVCSKPSFYRLTKEMEEQGLWHFWKGDCRTDTPESNAEKVSKPKESQ